MFIDHTYLFGLLGVVGADLRSENSEHTMDSAKDRQQQYVIVALRIAGQESRLRAQAHVASTRGVA
jgi:hypothetical protein